MAKKFVRDISASTVQVLLNQIFGLAIFYLLSKFLSKEVFGELNWSIAIISTFILVIGMGLEQIVLKRVAIRKNPIMAARVFIFHTLLSSFLFLMLLLILWIVTPRFFEKHYLLMGIAAASVITYLASPFKQIANGNEKFFYLAIMSLASNLAKTILLVLLISFSTLQPRNLILIFVLSSLVELLFSALIIYKRLKQPILPLWSKREFKALVKESFPQLGVLIFDSALARIDWIMLGIIAGVVATAEYSFAYKIFEISRLPMLVIAPVLLPKLSRYFLQGNLPDSKKEELRLLLKAEAIMAVMIPLVLNLAWVPFIPMVTDNKYGEVNELVYLILSCSIPLHYLTNFLWTMAFAQQQVRLTFFITICVSTSNILLNLALIPSLGTTGAAIAFTTSTVLQVILYKRFTNQAQFSVNITDFIICFITAGLIVFILRRLEINFFLKSIAGLSAYLLVIFLLGVVKRREFKGLQILFAK